MVLPSGDLNAVFLAMREFAGQDLAALAERRRADVVAWRQPALGSRPHWPDPWASERAGAESRWLADEDAGAEGKWIGLDAGGRPVIAEVRWPSIGRSRLDEVWFHDAGWSDRVTPQGSLRVLRDDGRVSAVVGVDGGGLLVERWRWDGDVPVRGDIGVVREDHVVSEAYAADTDEHGRIVSLRRGVEVADRTEPDDHNALAAAVDHAGELVAAEFVFPQALVTDGADDDPPDIVDGPPLRSIPARARRDRGALAALLSEHGLAEHAAQIAEDVAEVGLRLTPNGSAVRSRLGGPALLAAGEDWPHTGTGRALTFLAGIDLAELPYHGLLPSDGWLLFYADIDNGEALGLVDHSSNASTASARAFYLPTGTQPVEVSPPASLREVLLHRPVVATAQLTLPDDYEAGKRLGLTHEQRHAYFQIAERMRYGDLTETARGSDHWMLGAWTSVQGQPVDPATTLLLHLADDPGLGFAFMDAGAIQFRIPDRALAECDWTAITAEADTA